MNSIPFHAKKRRLALFVSMSLILSALLSGIVFGDDGNLTLNNVYPNVKAAGDKVTISGSSGIDEVNIKVYAVNMDEQDGELDIIYIGVAESDSNNTYSTYFSIPSSMDEGIYVIVASNGAGTAAKAFSVSNEITNDTVTLDAISNAEQGGKVSVNGSTTLDYVNIKVFSIERETLLYVANETGIIGSVFVNEFRLADTTPAGNYLVVAGNSRVSDTDVFTVSEAAVEEPDPTITPAPTDAPVPTASPTPSSTATPSPSATDAPSDNDDDDDDDSSSSIQSQVVADDSVPLANVAVDVDVALDEQVLELLGNNEDIIITVSDNNHTLEAETIVTVIESGKPVSLVNNNTTVVLTTDILNALNISDGDQIGISYTANTSDVVESAEINDILLANTYSFVIEKNGTAITSLYAPLTIRYDMSDYDLTDEQKAQLTGIIILSDGQYMQLGGKWTEDNIFEFQTSIPGTYGIIVSDNLVRLEFVIDRASYMLNGTNIPTDAAPYIVNGRTMVPVRYIAEAFGAEVGWDEVTRTVTITLDGQTLSMTIGETTEGMGVPPVIINDRTFVPLRYVSETLGANVIWNADTRSIDIYR